MKSKSSDKLLQRLSALGDYIHQKTEQKLSIGHLVKTLIAGTCFEEICPGIAQSAIHEDNSYFNKKAVIDFLMENINNRDRKLMEIFSNSMVEDREIISQAITMLMLNKQLDEETSDIVNSSVQVGINTTLMCFVDFVKQSRSTEVAESKALQLFLMTQTKTPLFRTETCRRFFDKSTPMLESISSQTNKMNQKYSYGESIDAVTRLITLSIVNVTGFNTDMLREYRIGWSIQSDPKTTVISSGNTKFEKQLAGKKKQELIGLLNNLVDSCEKLKPRTFVVVKEHDLPTIETINNSTARELRTLIEHCSVLFKQMNNSLKPDMVYKKELYDQCKFMASQRALVLNNMHPLALQKLIPDFYTRENVRGWSLPTQSELLERSYEALETLLIDITDQRNEFSNAKQ
jgi:hypothetical protein